MITPTEPERPDAQLLYQKVTWRLVPFLFICYVGAYLDRVNVGFAKLQMQTDLNFSDTVYGLGAGIFFIGYFFFEVPSNLLLARVGARLWIARIMVTWGIISAAQIFISSPIIFYSLRFLLGVAEAGFFPGIVLYFTYWYPASRRGRVMALFMTAIAITGVVGGPLSGLILQYFATGHGLAGWQWLFLLEGIPSTLLGIVVLFYLDDNIQGARWLTAEEKQVLTKNLELDPTPKHHLSISQTLRNGWVYLFSAVYFCSSMGLYGIGFWMPQIIKNTGVKDPLPIGTLTAIPYACAAVAMILIGRHSDLKNERRWHFVACSLAGAAGLILNALFPSHTAISLLALSLAAAGVLASFPLCWTMPTAMFGGSAAAAGIGLINSIGGLAGFVSPYLVGWLSDKTHRFDLGLYIIAAFLVVGAILIGTLIHPKLLSRSP